MIERMIFLFLFIAALWLPASGSEAGSGNFAPYSAHPPAGLNPPDVPQFVVFGFDDNAYSGLEGSDGAGGMQWVLDFFKDKKNPGESANSGTFDGEPCRVSFYLVGSYGDSGVLENGALVRNAWRRAWLDGHEIGNHTYSHSDSLKFNPDEKIWTDEIERCNASLTAICQPEPDGYDSGTGRSRRDGICGFRTPFLAYTEEAFAVIKKQGFLYDCSIEDGWQREQDGTNFCWPYTLDSGSPGDEWLWKVPGVKRPRPLGAYPGLWELPLHPLMVPPDAACGRYDIPPGLGKRIKEQYFWFDETGNKVPGLDYNLFFHCKPNREEALAVLKYSFDLHYHGNRAPFSLGTHSDIYSSKYPFKSVPTDFRDRQWVMEQFINYILTKPDVRIVPACKVIAWCGNPRPLHVSGGR
jgi:peptidoglycan/xylan/chitin deacetylase (PgdA/CDA1 family)